MCNVTDSNGNITNVKTSKPSTPVLSGISFCRLRSKVIKLWLILSVNLGVKFFSEECYAPATTVSIEAHS